MVLRETSAGWYLVTQPAHAELAAGLARHWQFPTLPRIDDPEFLTAVARHDSGWETVDRQPHFNSDGSPVSFLEWPLTSAVEVWRDSIEEARSRGSRGGCAVARHFVLLGRMALGRTLAPGDRTAVEQFIAVSEPRPLDPVVEHWAALLQICDLLSLHLVTGGRMSTALLEKIGVAAQFDEATSRLSLDPFPFGRPLKLACPARFLPRNAKVPAESDPLRFVVAPGSGRLNSHRE